jgi:hypothetical protein
MKGIAVRILSLLVTLAAVNAARADYLYWMIASDSELEMEGESFSNYAFARVQDVKTGTWLSVYDASGSKTSATAADKATMTSGAMLWGDFDTALADQRSFLFELYSDTREVVAWQTVTLSYLMEQNNIGTKLDPALVPYVLTSVIPEPTGGMLVLLGTVMLALRRRRVHT